MKATIQHSIYGEITYDESFWSGKKTLFVNGTPLDKMDKKTFALNREGRKILFSIQGNFLSGTKLLVDGESLQITPPAKWYEIACSVFIFVLILIWGNSVALCSILPVVGGAIGGGISGMMAILNLFAMKSTQKLWLKLVIWLVILLATFFICFEIAMALLSALQ